MGVFGISAPFMAYVIFLVYVARGNDMVVEDVFMALSLLRAVRVGMILFFPSCVQVVNEAFVSLSRIQVHNVDMQITSES